MALRATINTNQSRWDEMRSNPKLMGWFVGQTMKALNGVGSPYRINRAIAFLLRS